MKAVYKHVAVRPAGEKPLEVEICKRLHLALLANVMEFPFVYTPIKYTASIAKSEFSPDVLNRQWKAFFRQVADEFMHIDAPDGDLLLLDDDFGVSKRLFARKGDHSLSDRLFLSDATKEVLEKAEVSSSKLHQPVRKEIVRESIRRFHRTYVKTFTSGTRASFEDNILQAVFIMHEDGGLRAPFLFDRLVPLMDFVEEHTRRVGRNLQLHLLTSFELDQVVPDCWAVHKAHALEAACSRSYVHLHQSPSFEKMMNMFAGADVSWVSGTFYGRDVLRQTLMLTSRPEQAVIEILPSPNSFRFNQCFLGWDGKRLFYEKGKMSEVLGTAERDPHRRTAFFMNFKKRILSAKKQLRKRSFNIVAGVVDGVGSCFLKIFLLQLVSDYYDLRYIHTYRMALDHNYKAVFDWERKWERFFMPGEGRPGLNTVFGSRSPDVFYCYMLPTLKELKSLNLPSDSLIVSNMASFFDHPVPDDYLSQKILQARTSFHDRHRYKKNRFGADVINVAVHIRAVDDYLLPVKRMYQEVYGIDTRLEVDACAARIRVFYNTMQQLGTPFNFHVYSDAHRGDLEPLLGFGDVRLHLAEEADDWRLHCLEMSRADVFLPSYSRISLTAAVLAQPNQLQLITSGVERDILRLLICGGNAFYREHIDILKDVKLLERFLDGRA